MLISYSMKRIAYWHAGEASQFSFKYKRVVLPILLLALLCTDVTHEIVINTLSDAFWAVSTYVAFTLIIYHYLSIFIDKPTLRTT